MAKRRSLFVVEGKHPQRLDGWRMWEVRLLKEQALVMKKQFERDLAATGWKFRVVRYDASK